MQDTLSRTDAWHFAFLKCKKVPVIFNRATQTRTAHLVSLGRCRLGLDSIKESARLNQSTGSGSDISDVAQRTNSHYICASEFGNFALFCYSSNK